jgi:hypothetical protein
MTDQAPWTKYRANHGVHIVGEFENEHGERFVIYRNGDADGNATGDTPYITGDEFDWEPKIGLLWPEFVFTAEERDEIAKILWPTMEESVAKIRGQEGSLAFANDWNGSGKDKPSGPKGKS